MEDNKNLTIEETFNLAVKNHQEGKTDIAQELYNKVLQTDPNYVNAHYNLSFIYRGFGENQKAIDCYEKVITIDPNYADAHNNLGAIFKELGDDQNAKSCYEKAISIDPNHAHAHNNLGVIYQNLGELQKAREYYEKAIKINPNYADAHNNLGNIFNDLKENQKAIDCYEKVITINPNHSQVLNNLAVIFINLKEHQKARECYEKVIELNPNYAVAHYNLGVVFKELGDDQKSKSCFEKAIELNPNYAVAQNNLGVIFRELGDDQKSKSCFEKAIELNPNYADAHNNLGNIFNDLKENQKAIDWYKKAIKINPNYINAHNNLGVIFERMGENQKAKEFYEKAIEIDPNNIDSINCLSSFLNLYQFNYKTKTDKNNFKKLLLLLFRKNNINHSNISANAKLLLLTDSEQNQLEETINSDPLLSNKILQKLLGEELFHLLLQKSISTDIFLEKLLTKLRYEILFTFNNTNKKNLNKHFDFIISLAEQCWLNEYLYVQSAKEIDLVNKLKQKIESDKEINEIEIAILACNSPLNKSKIIIEKLLNYKSSNLLFNDLISVQIKEPLKEIKLKKSINSLDKVIDPVSIKVQEQYEEHPYPRWGHTSKILSKNFINWLKKEIEPNKTEVNDKLNNPNVLIAGCGTGYQSILATRYKNANILAIDLSLASIAYAKRKTEELKIKNIEYLHGDILHLKKLNKKFDVIESTGVLHHMKDPITGLKILLDILEPHGYLKLALYSKIARQHVVKAKELIKERNYKNTTKDIKNFRQDILDKKVDPLIQKVTAYLDFYSTSDVRDLLFHVQEHQFTIPQISEMLKDLNLEFLGFFFSNPLVKKKFSKSFPEDKNNVSLDSWHQFEKNNPDIFIGMYQFWVRKI